MRFIAESELWRCDLVGSVIELEDSFFCLPWLFKLGMMGIIEKKVGLTSD